MESMHINGEGKYDGSAEMLLARLDAKAVLVGVIEGNKGNGFSVCTKEALVLVKLPEILRNMADQLEQTLKSYGAPKL